MKTTATLPAKQLLQLHRSTATHWVGDGFPVRSVFTYDDLGRDTLSPFLLMDYTAPHVFPPGRQQRGVGEHPHRGFETVTLAYQGEVEHRDSAGGGGQIGPGDVQWMTAASGVMHEEMHSRDFTARGGPFEMIQLWINLPAKDKMSAPRYQTLRKEDIPDVPLPGGGRARVIAGDFQSHRGPARTFTPINVWELHLPAGATTALDLPAGHTTAAFVLKGRVAFNAGAEETDDATLALFSREGRAVILHSRTDATVLVLSGQPIAEPVVGYGPFVMNTTREIQQAVADVQAGRFGRLAPAAS